MNQIFNSEENKILVFIFFTIFISISYIFLPNLPPNAGLSLFINNVIWLTCCVFLFFIILNSTYKDLWVKPENFIVHLLLIMALVIPFIWSDDISGRGFYRMLAAVFGVLFFLGLFNFFTKKNIWLLLLIVSISGFIQACWGIIQLWILPDLGVPYGVPTGAFLQTNVMSSYLVITLLASFMLLKVYPVPIDKINTYLYPCIYIFALFIGVLIVPLNSTTAYLSLLISIPLMTLFHWQEPKYVLIATMSLLLGVSTSLVLDGDLNISMNAETSGDYINTMVANSLDSGGRKSAWLISWEIFKNNWLMGVGYGNFEHSFMEYQAQYYQQQGIYAFEKINHPHNEFILWSVEGGILPALAFMGYTSYVLFRMFRLGKVALPYAAVLIPLVAHALLEFPFYHSAIHWILFVILLFLFELRVTNTNTLNVNFKKIISATAFIFLLPTSFFFITNMQAINTLNNYNKSAFQERDVKVLSNIINDFSVRTHIDYLYMDTLLRRGISEKNKLYINQSIFFSEKLNTNHPRPAYYKYLLIAYEALDDKESFEAKLQEARYLYPLNEYFIGVERRYKLMF